jgi:exopolysaccharide biosynthesis polyprenyl glycosylphosphotransferase
MSSITVDDPRFLGLDLLDAPEREVAPDHVQVPSPSRGRSVGPIFLADLAALSLALVLGLLVLSAITTVPRHSLARFGTNLVDDLSFVVAAPLAFCAYGLYRQDRRRLQGSSVGDLGRLLHAVVAAVLVAVGVSAFLQHVLNRAGLDLVPLIVVGTATLVLVPISRAAVRRIGARAAGPGMRVLIVGSGMMADRIQRYFAPDADIEVVGLVDDDPVPGTIVAGTVADIPRLCRELHVDRVLVGFSRTHPAETMDWLRGLQGTVPISIVPRYFELLSWRSQVDDVCGLPVIDVAPPSLGLRSRVVKRSVDLVVSSVCLVVAAPLLLASALAVKLSSSGPVFFRQERVGRHGRSFTMLKLRTMRDDSHHERDDLRTESDTDGPLFKLREDPRVFPVGRILRRTSIDELPQLINVLMGQMSLVGPRPFVADESDEIDGWAARRFEVRPGITGLWQVSGRSELSFDELRRLDYLYVASWSLAWDLRILWQTPSAVLSGLGAY